MKKLEEYETPETDAELERSLRACHSYSCGPDFARDIERKLAMCRDALRELTEECDYMKRSTEDWRPFHAAREQARITLKATEPK